MAVLNLIKRSPDTKFLDIPERQTRRFGGRVLRTGRFGRERFNESLLVRAPRLWNSLPIKLRVDMENNQFKSLLVKYYLDKFLNLENV